MVADNLKRSGSRTREGDRGPNRCGARLIPAQLQRSQDAEKLAHVVAEIALDLDRVGVLADLDDLAVRQQSRQGAVELERGRVASGPNLEVLEVNRATLLRRQVVEDRPAKGGTG